METRTILAVNLLFFFFSNNIYASSVFPINVDIIDSDIRGSWSIDRSRGWNNRNEIKVTTDLTGSGSMDVKFRTELNTESSLNGFSVDLDMFNQFSHTNKNTWESFDISLGTGLGSTFITSDNNDELYFNLNRRTEDENRVFLFDKSDYNSDVPDEISFWDGSLLPGINEPGKRTTVSSLTFFINAGDSIDLSDDGFATFTMRVTGLTAVPLPAAWLLFLSGTTFLRFMSKRQNRL